MTATLTPASPGAPDPVRRSAAGSGWRPMAALLAGAGAVHLARPQVYYSLIPPVLGPPKPWVIGSGVVELACAVGLALPATRRPAALATCALMVAVFPGNVEMLRRVLRSEQPAPAMVAAAVARLPLQWPLIRQAWRVAQSARAA